MVPNTGVMSAVDYDRAAQEYLESLPLEHFMEATAQATQREITVESLALLRSRRPDVQYFNELLVQYHFAGQLRQVVPDNMVIRGSQPLGSKTNYAVEREPERPFLTLEYVSAASRRKDYVESFEKYELKVPYCILFEPEIGKLGVHHHEGQAYAPVPPNRHGRFPIPELDLEVGLLGGWLRFWHQGKLLELPAELDRRLAAQAERIDRLTSELDRVTLRLRRTIERQAMRAGRQDILDQLPATADLERLEQWAEELEAG